MIVIWKPIPGYEALYAASNIGQIKSLKSGKLLKESPHQHGYQRVFLCKNGVVKTFLIHRLVAQAFIPNPNNLPKVLHRDDNRANNRVENLFWGTQADNLRDMASKNRQRVKKRPVIGLSPDGLGVYYFESMIAASKKTGIIHQGIRMCCQGKRKTAGGFIWQYAIPS